MGDAGETALRVVGLHEREQRRDYADVSPAERVSVMWQLAVDAWTFMGKAERAESPLQRDVVHIERRGC
jgi:hypothetical protein